MFPQSAVRQGLASYPRDSQLGVWLREARRRVWLLAREDKQVTLLVGIFSALQVASALWDLPCMYGWENDGIAPRDLFGGLSANLTPGGAHRYPLFHYLLLGLWPITVAP